MIALAILFIGACVFGLVRLGIWMNKLPRNPTPDYSALYGPRHGLQYGPRYGWQPTRGQVYGAGATGFVAGALWEHHHHEKVEARHAQQAQFAADMDQILHPPVHHNPVPEAQICVFCNHSTASWDHNWHCILGH